VASFAVNVSRPPARVKIAAADAIDFARFIPYYGAAMSTKQVTIRLELRVSEEMNTFLQMEAHSRKMSFEGLILMYLEERMKKDRIDRQHGPQRT
jgi:hypothetical protein